MHSKTKKYMKRIELTDEEYEVFVEVLIRGSYFRNKQVSRVNGHQGIADHVMLIEGEPSGEKAESSGFMFANENLS